MQRKLYHELLKEHFAHEGNMAFLMGPRQSGKTTTATHFLPQHTSYWNWDDADDRLWLRSSSQKFLEQAKERVPQKVLFVLDEIHKNKKWRTWLKGLYDKHHEELSFIVTGSARFHVFRRGGESLLGRYYLYRHHPFSLGEIEDGSFVTELFRTPHKTSNEQMKTLLRYGGFPKPFLSARDASHRKWLRMRRDLLLREDLRDLSRVEDVAAIELLVQLLLPRVGQLLNYHNIVHDIEASVDSIRRWIQLLNNLYYTYLILPYTHQVKRSLKKMPKLFLWDWSEVPDEAARFENMVASHLLKATHYWTDKGLGNFELYYIRDKEKREVDFLVTKEQKPFLLAECKLAETNISPHLHYFSQKLTVPYSCQVVLQRKAEGKSLLEIKPCEVISASDFCQSLP